jgi:hypothetical protein
VFVISLKGKGMFSNNKEQLADWVKSELKKYLSDEGATSDGTPTFGAYLKLCVSFLHVLQVWEDLFDLTCISISINSTRKKRAVGSAQLIVPAMFHGSTSCGTDGMIYEFFTQPVRVVLA